MKRKGMLIACLSVLFVMGGCGVFKSNCDCPKFSKHGQTETDEPWWGAVQHEAPEVPVIAPKQ